MFLCILAVICFLPNRAWGHCYGIGANPGFSDVPNITQLSPFRVRVSWENVVTQRECSDHFLVKYWTNDEPLNIHVSQLVGQTVDHLDIEVLPEVKYTFIVVAREIKKLFGVLWDTDDNHSKRIVFQTSYDPGKLYSELRYFSRF